MDIFRILFRILLKFHRILALKIFQETDYLPAVIGTRRAADEIK